MYQYVEKMTTSDIMLTKYSEVHGEWNVENPSISYRFEYLLEKWLTFTYTIKRMVGSSGEVERTLTVECTYRPFGNIYTTHSFSIDLDGYCTVINRKRAFTKEILFMFDAALDSAPSDSEWPDYATPLLRTFLADNITPIYNAVRISFGYVNPSAIELGKSRGEMYTPQISVIPFSQWVQEQEENR